MQRILISGYTGFIGSNLVKEIGHNILYGIDVVQESTVLKHYNWDDFINNKDSNVFIHLAGKAHDVNNLSDEKDFFDINVGLTRKIFQHFLDSSAEKFIFFSSVKAVADLSVESLTEGAQPAPATAYGRSKLEAERYISDAFAEWKAKESNSKRDSGTKRVYIIRPCMVHGPGNKGNLNLLYKFQQRNLPWPLGGFENKRSYCSIDNLVYVINMLIERPIESGTYQIADDEALSTNEIIKLIAQSLDRKARILKIPRSLILIAAKIGGIFFLPLNSDRLSKLTGSYLVSNKKIKNVLGIDNMPLSAVDGIRKTCNSFKINSSNRNL